MQPYSIINMIVAAVCLLCLTVTAGRAQTTFTGRWMIDYDSRDDDVRLTLRYEWDEGGYGYGTTSFDIDIDRLEDLTRDAMMADGAVAAFRIVQDAGAIQCVRRERGFGDLTVDELIRLRNHGFR